MRFLSLFTHIITNRVYSINIFLKNTEKNVYVNFENIYICENEIVFRLILICLFFAEFLKMAKNIRKMLNLTSLAFLSNRGTDHPIL